MSDSLDVLRWIEFSARDYATAHKISLLHEPVPLEIVCYLCQQSAEKILKAYTIAQGEPLKRTHDLETLLGQCIQYDDQFDIFADSCAALTEYAAATRYPPDDDWITETEMNAALKDAAEILEFTKSRLAGFGYELKSE